MRAPPTDYTDDVLRDTASTIYQTESEAARHYETLRVSLAGLNGALCAGLLSFAKDVNSTNIGLVIIFVVQAFIFWQMSLRISLAHADHWYRARRMQGVLLRVHPKVEAKFTRANRQSKVWKLKQPVCCRRLGIDQFWDLINAIMPGLAALGLGFFALFKLFAQ